MSERDDSGPAFPAILGFDSKGDVTPIVGGMSLRDYFAGQALAGMADKSAPRDWNAHAAYQMADAMLEARKVKP